MCAGLRRMCDVTAFRESLQPTASCCQACQACQASETCIQHVLDVFLPLHLLTLSLSLSLSLSIHMMRRRILQSVLV
jgi:hypothetical protein